jgi:hypothetical protein
MTTVRYGKLASEKVGRVLHEFQRGKLTIGKSDKKVKSRVQAIAIGLSEAKALGGKVPHKTSAAKRTINAS